MVDLSSAVRRGHPIAFGIFTSAVVADFNSNGQPASKLVRDSTRFMVFAGWWGFLFSLVYVRTRQTRADILTVRLVSSFRALVASFLRLPRTLCSSLLPGSSGCPARRPSRPRSAARTAMRATTAFRTARLSVPSAPSAGLAGTYSKGGKMANTPGLSSPACSVSFATLRTRRSAAAAA